MCDGVCLCAGSVVMPPVACGAEMTTLYVCVSGWGVGREGSLAYALRKVLDSNEAEMKKRKKKKVNKEMNQRE